MECSCGGSTKTVVVHQINRLKCQSCGRICSLTLYKVNRSTMPSLHYGHRSLTCSLSLSFRGLGLLSPAAAGSFLFKDLGVFLAPVFVTE